MVQISCNLSFFIFFHVTLTLPVVSGKRKHIFKFVKTLWGNEWGKANPKKMKLKLQSWQWPFVFELPRNIPPSVEYKKGKVLLPHTFTLFDCFVKSDLICLLILLLLLVCRSAANRISIESSCQNSREQFNENSKKSYCWFVL
jgi:hypothetical protein